MDPAKLRLNKSVPNPTSRKVSTAGGAVAVAAQNKKSALQLQKQRQIEMKKQTLLLSQLEQQRVSGGIADSFYESDSSLVYNQ